jgi:CheY-like chemotaxis protein
MAKIMLVEDDNNLREIYEARLLAEGYEIVSAQDGEQALALAVKEKPDLIISDIMMPKISGFDMLDILRSTPETKNTKIIMMTALSQAEDKERASKLGADRYLVKSQVTLEDVAKVAREVLADDDTVPAAAKDVPPTPGATVSSPMPVAVAPGLPTDPAPPTIPEPPATPPAEPPAAPMPPAEPPSSSPAVNAAAPATAAQEEAQVRQQIEQFVGTTPAQPPAPAGQLSTDQTSQAAATAAQLAQNVNDMLASNTPAPAPAPVSPTRMTANQISGKKIIAPITNQEEKTPTVLNKLLAKEADDEEAATPTPVLPPQPTFPEQNKTPGNIIHPSPSDNADPNTIAL